MKSLAYYIGVGIVLAAIAMIIHASIIMVDLHKVHQLSFDVLNPGFWLNNPDNYGSGLTKNGKWGAFISGGIVVFLVGRHIQNLSARL